MARISDESITAVREAADIVQEVNRYSQSKVTLDAPGLADVRVTGVFDSGDVGAFVSAVCALHPLKAEPGADGGVRLVPAGPESPAG